MGAASANHGITLRVVRRLGSSHPAKRVRAPGEKLTSEGDHGADEATTKSLSTRHSDANIGRHQGSMHCELKSRWTHRCWGHSTRATLHARAGHAAEAHTNVDSVRVLHDVVTYLHKRDQRVKPSVSSIGSWQGWSVLHRHVTDQLHHTCAERAPISFSGSMGPTYCVRAWPWLPQSALRVAVVACHSSRHGAQIGKRSWSCGRCRALHP